MAKVIRIARLDFCQDGAQLASAEAKGAGWVVRTSELRISAPTDQVRKPRNDGGAGYWIAAVATSARAWVEREYRILRRKAVRSGWKRSIDAAAQALRFPKLAFK